MVVYQKPLREHAPSINSPVMDKERWGLVLCAPFSALDTGIWVAGITFAHKNHILLIPKGSFLEKVEEKEPSDPGSPGKMATKRKW